jgi:hypothetical protein
MVDIARYKACLRMLMSFKDDVNYPKDTEFTAEKEYEIGGPGRKPVKDWTAQERGKHKHSFYKRKFFWNKVSAMVRAGVEANDACERIYAAYGHNQSVTKILNALKRDSATGGHPNLHIRHI